jgi:hypothetical protein
LISPQNEQEFKDLGVERLRVRLANSPFDEAKTREAYE